VRFSCVVLSVLHSMVVF